MESLISSLINGLAISGAILFLTFQGENLIKAYGHVWRGEKLLEGKVV